MTDTLACSHFCYNTEKQVVMMQGQLRHRQPHVRRDRPSRAAAPLLGFALGTILAYPCPLLVWAGQSVGTVTRVTGEAVVCVNEECRPLDLGAEVPVGGRVRTGATAELRVVFNDETVLDVANQSELVIDRQVVDPMSNQYDSAFSLIRGRICLHVGDRYNAPAARFLITSPTAASTLTGGDFTFEYDSEKDVTEVAGLRGQVDVRNALRPHENGVLITARQATRVFRHRPPGAANEVDAALFELYRDTVTRAGTDWPVLVWQNTPILTGLAVARGADASSMQTETSVPTAQAKGRRSSVSSGEDVGALLGESPAALGSGGLRFGIRF